MTRTYADERARGLLAADLFEMGFEWAMMLRGQTLEDSRAVGRTLGCDLFGPISGEIEREIERQGFNSFETADLGICSAKAIIRAALSASQPDSDLVEKAARALAADHYGERFRRPVDDQQVAANVDANWNIYAGQARVALTAIRTLPESASSKIGGDHG